MPVDRHCAPRRLLTVGLRLVAIVVGLLIGAALLGACSGSSSPSDAGAAAGSTPRRLQVVATTPIVGEVVRAVAGDRADVAVLMGLDDDSPTFTVAADDPRLADADVVVAIDPATYETGLAPALGVVPGTTGPTGPGPTGGDPRGAGPTVLRAVDLLDARRVDGTPDPRIWLDPDRLTTFAREVAGALAERSGDDPDAWSAAAEAYGHQLALTDEQVQATLGPATPDQHRLLVVDDRLGYFADRYGIELVPLPPGADATVLVVDVDHLGPPGSDRATAGDLLAAIAAQIAAWP